ncbi:MAG: putative exporter [Gammaproteobacteria bacterium]|jgi:predicted exporter
MGARKWCLSHGSEILKFGGIMNPLESIPLTIVSGVIVALVLAAVFS